MHAVLGIGAAIVDIIIHVTDAFLESLSLSKGSVSCTNKQELDTLIKEMGDAALPKPGGSAANVIRGLAAFGWPCALTGKIGDDLAGHWLLDELQRRHITSHYLQSMQNTAQVLCLVTPDGERTMRDYLGASTEMRGQDLTPTFFTDKRLVHIEGYSLFNEGLTLQAMLLAQTAGADISFDLANFKIVEAYRDTIIQLLHTYVTIVFANAQEASTLTGKPPATACHQLGTWCSYAIVTLGANGCYVCHNHQLHHLPAQPITKLVDTTGAGDLFAAGFLDGWLRGYPPERCAMQGTLLSSVIIQRKGAVIDNTIQNFVSHQFPSQNWGINEYYSTNSP